MGTSENTKQTPLFGLHKKAKAKIVPFSGWSMPISYEGVIAEHNHVRNSCGIFDVSHMGEIFISGKQAKDYVQYLTINDVERLSPGKGQYTAILNQEGGVIDDLICYQLSDDSFLLCVNASNIQKDYEWIKQNSSSFDVEVTDESESWSQVAVQGPKSPDVVLKVFENSIETIKKLEYMDLAEIPLSGSGEKALIARTGYTGELGYEIYIPNKEAEQIWAALDSHPDVRPIGLGARDTLRLEACYLLYGNDMNDSISPIEAGIGWAVRLDTAEFIGKSVVEKQKTDGASRKMVAFLLEDKGIPRSAMDVYANDEKVGVVTSGSFLPSLNKSGGLALVDKKAVKVGDSIEIDVRGKRKLAKVTKRPLYSTSVK